MSLYEAATDVRNFHVVCDIPIGETPGLPARERRELRFKLLDEEAAEVIHAEISGDMVALAQELCDLIYVILGMALEYGIPPRVMDAVFREIHAANMRKASPETGKVERREDGKVLKPDGWTPPDIARAFADAIGAG